MGILAAFQFLTIIPLRREVNAQGIGRSLAYFPLVGLVIGGFLFGLDRLLEMAFPQSIVNVLLIVALLIITRALHLDGFIDTCDGLAGGRLPKARLEIMRDSRVGSFGVAGACCLILLKYVCLISLPDGQRMEALILMPAIARWTMVYAVYLYPYAREREGMGASFKAGVKWPGVTIATVITLASCLALMRLDGLAVMASALFLAMAAAIYFNRKLAGLTGDTYGAINEIVEVAVLILIPLITWSYGV